MSKILKVVSYMTNEYELIFMVSYARITRVYTSLTLAETVKEYINNATYEISYKVADGNTHDFSSIEFTLHTDNKFYANYVLNNKEYYTITNYIELDKTVVDDEITSDEIEYIENDIESCETYSSELPKPAFYFTKKVPSKCEIRFRRAYSNYRKARNTKITDSRVIGITADILSGALNELNYLGINVDSNGNLYRYHFEYLIVYNVGNRRHSCYLRHTTTSRMFDFARSLKEHYKATDIMVTVIETGYRYFI